MAEETQQPEPARDSCDVFRHDPAIVQRLRYRVPDDEELENAEKFFSALGNRTRLMILVCLDYADELCVCDLAAALQRSTSAVSHELRQLRCLGLVTYRREGRKAFYRLSNRQVAALARACLNTVPKLNDHDE